MGNFAFICRETGTVLKLGVVDSFASGDSGSVLVSCGRLAALFGGKCPSFKKILLNFCVKEFMRILVEG